MSHLPSKPKRVLYLAGPGNVLGTYNYWKNGQDDPSQISVTYSSQFFDVCKALDAEGYIISSYSEPVFIHDQQFTIEHRPNRFSKASGLLYHFGLIWYGLRLLLTAILWRADAVVAADGMTYWFVLSPLPLLGVKVIPSLHCVLNPIYLPPRKVEKVIAKLNSFLLSHSQSILVISDEVSKQVKQIIGERSRLLEFTPVYRHGEFNQVTPPNPDQLPFRVLFIGRVEENKGVFDLLEIAKRFAMEEQINIHFDICGSGPALEAFREQIREANLEPYFALHGYCNKLKLHQMLSQAHVVVAPTRKTFIEGFCKVVVEGILAGRPVLTSPVCPASAYVPSAVVKVAPDDVQAYGDALLKLYRNREFYEKKRRGCFEVQKQFYDTSKSWGAALKLSLIT